MGEVYNMGERKKVLVDVDGVLFNLLEFVKQELAKEGKDFYYENTIDYAFHGNIGCKRSDIFRQFEKPNIHEKDYTYAGCVEALKRLQEHVDVIAYTLAYPTTCEARNKYIKEMGMTGTAYLYTENTHKPVVENCVAVFEDNPAIYETFKNVKDCKVYLINHSYNKEYCGYPDFPTAVDHFIKEYCVGEKENGEISSRRNFIYG